MKNYFFKFAVVLIILAAVFFLGIRELKEHEPKSIITEKIDTFYSVTVVNAEIPEPTVKTEIKYVHDTLYAEDSTPVAVQVPIATKVYTDDSTYRAVVSGYKTTLDSMQVKQKTITAYKTVYKTVPEYKKYKFGIGPQLGWGANPNGSGFYIGVGVHYNLIQF